MIPFDQQGHVINRSFDQQGQLEGSMKKEYLSVSDYGAFETARETARGLVVRAIEELREVLAQIDISPSAGPTIIHVATKTKVTPKKIPQLCRSALELIYEGLDAHVITDAEMGAGNREMAYKCLGAFMVTLTIVKGQPLLEGIMEGPLESLGMMLENVR
jgi:hypothetical protein